MHVILVHGWKGFPDNAWFPWLRKELEQRGYTTEALHLPSPALPDREEWVAIVRKAIVSPDTIIVAHSLGCPTTLFALQAYDGPSIARVVLVSGFARSFPVPLLSRWFGDARIDLKAVKAKSRSWRVLHNRFDYLVPAKEGEWMAQELGVPVTEVESHLGHLMHEERAFEVPEILQAVIDEKDLHG